MLPPTATSTDLASCQRDPLFFFEDVYFLVGDTIFRVPRHHFEEGSPKFRDMFGLPGLPKTAKSLGENGQQQENPLHRLPGIDINDFRQLLRVLYPRHFEDEKLEPPQWIAVLKLATTWSFEKVRQLAIKALGDIKIDGITRLHLSQEYTVTEWIKPALHQLIRKNELKDEWMQKIGIPTHVKLALLIGQARGHCGLRGSKGNGNQKIDISEEDMNLLINDVFFPELSTTHNGTKTAPASNNTTNGATHIPNGQKRS